MKLLFVVLVSTLSLSAFANGSDWKRQERPKIQEQQKQKMEEAPISGSIGGAKSGELYEQGDQKEQMQHDAEKQKFLYEYGDYYRRGL